MFLQAEKARQFIMTPDDSVLPRPKNPSGMKGLADLLDYLLIVKAMKNPDDPMLKRRHSKLGKITNLISNGMDERLTEYRKIQQLISLCNKSKRKLLTNLMAEKNFKVILKSEKKESHMQTLL